MNEKDNNIIQGDLVQEIESFSTPEIASVTDTQDTVTIPANNLKPVSPLKVPKDESQPIAQQTSEGILSSIQPQVDTTIEKQSELQRLTNEANARNEDVQSEQRLLAETLGPDETNLFEDRRKELDPIQKDIGALTELVNSKQASIRKGLLDEAGRAIPQQFITGRQRQIALQGSAELADLTGLLQAKQGNLALAQDNIDRSIAARKEARNSNIKRQELLLGIAEDISGKADEARQAELARLQGEADEQEANEKEIRDLVLKNAGSIPNDVAAAVLAAEDTDEAFNKLLPYLGESEKLDMQLKRLNIISKTLDAAQQEKALNAIKEGKIFVKPNFENATFARRIGDANAVFDSIDLNQAQLFGKDAKVPLLGVGVPGLLQSAEAKQVEQAERNFVNAVLRVESGASISPEEFESAAKQYFPRVGDDAKTLANKKRNREVAFEGMQAQAGGAFDELSNVVGETATRDTLDTTLDAAVEQEQRSPEQVASNNLDILNK